MLNLSKHSTSTFFVELYIQGTPPVEESLHKLAPLLFHPDYLKIHTQPVIGISGNLHTREWVRNFFIGLGYSEPLIVSNNDNGSFFVPIHGQNTALQLGDAHQHAEFLVTESFLYVTDSKNNALVDLEDMLDKQFFENPYFITLMERNSKLYEQRLKLLAQAEQISNLQVYNDRLRTESKKEIDWNRNELQNYLAWHESTKLSFSNLFRKAKKFLRRWFSF